MFYITFFSGWALAFWAIVFANDAMKGRVLWLLKIILAIKIILSFLVLLFLFLARPDQSGRMPFPVIYRISSYLGYFFAGNLSMYVCVRWTRKANREKLDSLITPVINEFDWLLRWAIAVLFIWSGLVKLLYPTLDARFFSFSGYSQGFLVFIALTEIVGGLGLLVKRTTAYAAAILIVDMAGAIYTHFHNYIVRDAPGPFSNSQPALAVQVFLVAILVMAFRRGTTKFSRSGIGVTVNGRD